MRGNGLLVRSAVVRHAACVTAYADDYYDLIGVAASIAVRTQMPTLMRVKRFRVTPASSRTFWTDFLLSSAYG